MTGLEELADVAKRLEFELGTIEGRTKGDRLRIVDIRFNLRDLAAALRARAAITSARSEERERG